MVENPAQPSKSFPEFLRVAAVGILVLFVGQLGLGYWVARQIQKRLEVHLNGHFYPVPLAPSFFSQHAALDWKNRVTILSGKLKIDYNLFPLITHNSIRIHVRGKNIRAKLSGDWARMEGVENIQVDTFEADLEIGRKGLGEIDEVHAESPSFQFHISKNKT
jgi:hypothetical protein